MSVATIEGFGQSTGWAIREYKREEGVVTIACP
jgi:hypothetical protein